MITLSASSDYGLSGQYIARITGRNTKYTFEREFIGRKCGKRNEMTEADVDDPGLYECCDIGRKKGKESRFVLVLEVEDELYKFTCDKSDAMTIAKELDSGRELDEIVIGRLADQEAVEVKKELDYLNSLIIIEGYPNWISLMETKATIRQKVGDFDVGATVDQKELQPVVKSEIDRLNNKLKDLESQNRRPIRDYELISKKEAEKKQAAQTFQTALDSCWQILQSLPTKDAKKILSELKNKLNPKSE